MRREIIEALTYPRLSALDAILGTNCPHSGEYDPTDIECVRCELRRQCLWLGEHDAFRSLAQRPMQELVESLSVAVGFVECLRERRGHASRMCVCAGCVWVNDARQLLNRAEGKAASV